MKKIISLIILLSFNSYAKDIKFIELPKDFSITSQIEENNKFLLYAMDEKKNKTYYFSLGGELNEYNNSFGYYFRKILGKTKDNSCIVQDFYNKQKTKLNEPYLVNEENCKVLFPEAYDYKYNFTYDERGNLLHIVIRDVIQGDNNSSYNYSYLSKNFIKTDCPQGIEYISYLKLLSKDKFLWQRQARCINQFNLNGKSKYGKHLETVSINFDTAKDTAELTKITPDKSLTLKFANKTLIEFQSKTDKQEIIIDVNSIKHIETESDEDEQELLELQNTINNIDLKYQFYFKEAKKDLISFLENKK